MLEHLQGEIGFIQWHWDRMRPNWDFAGDFKEFLTVLTGIGGDAAQFLFVEQMPLVIERWDCAQVNPRHRQNTTTIQRLQRAEYEVAGRCEQDCRIQWRRRWVMGP